MFLAELGVHYTVTVPPWWFYSVRSAPNQTAWLCHVRKGRQTKRKPFIKLKELEHFIPSGSGSIQPVQLSWMENEDSKKRNRTVMLWKKVSPVNTHKSNSVSKL